MLDEVPLNDHAHGFASRSKLLPKGDVSVLVEESANVAVTMNCSAPSGLDVPSISQITPVAESTVASLVAEYSMMKLSQLIVVFKSVNAVSVEVPDVEPLKARTK